MDMPAPKKISGKIAKKSSNRSVLQVRGGKWLKFPLHNKWLDNYFFLKFYFTVHTWRLKFSASSESSNSIQQGMADSSSHMDLGTDHPPMLPVAAVVEDVQPTSSLPTAVHPLPSKVSIWNPIKLFLYWWIRNLLIITSFRIIFLQ